MIAHRHQKDSLSLSAFSRRLAPLSGGVWSHSLCLVRVPSIRSIRTRTRQRKRDQTLPPLSLEHSLTTSVAIISSVWSGPVRYGSGRGLFLGEDSIKPMQHAEYCQVIPPHRIKEHLRVFFRRIKNLFKALSANSRPEATLSVTPDQLQLAIHELLATPLKAG